MQMLETILRSQDLELSPRRVEIRRNATINASWVCPPRLAEPIIRRQRLYTRS